MRPAPVDTAAPALAEAAASSDVLMRRAFAAYNERDVDGLLALVSEDVLWHGDIETLRGKKALRRYLEEQWTRTVTWDEVTSVEERPGGYVVVTLDQVVRSVDGSAVSSGRLKYGFVVDGAMIAELRTRTA